MRKKKEIPELINEEWNEFDSTKYAAIKNVRELMELRRKYDPESSTYMLITNRILDEVSIIRDLSSVLLDEINTIMKYN